MYYYWLSLISMAVLYNFIIIPVRIALEELDQGVYFQMWLCLDIMADILYVLDFFASFRIGMLCHRASSLSFLRLQLNAYEFRKLFTDLRKISVRKTTIILLK